MFVFLKFDNGCFLIEVFRLFTSNLIFGMVGFNVTILLLVPVCCICSLFLSPSFPVSSGLSIFNDLISIGLLVIPNNLLVIPNF